MADINDLFGPGVGKGRPEHPDYWRLSDHILKLDANFDPTDRAMPELKRERLWKERVAESGVDIDSLVYVANQRAMRICGVTSALDLLNPATFEQVAQLTSVWIEAFTMGTLFEREDDRAATAVLEQYRDLSATYAKIDDLVTAFQHEDRSAESTLSDIAAVLADHESGTDV